MRTIVKQITAPINVIEAGEALAAKYTGGNFSKLIRLLIESAVKDDELPAGAFEQVEG